MYLCYLDESGTSSIPGNTSHFVLAGLSIPIWHWKGCDRDVAAIKQRFGLKEAELHTAWLLRKYIEQTKISSFASKTWTERRAEVEKYRRGELLRLQNAGNSRAYRQAKKNYGKTKDYVHLTYEERKDFIHQVASCVSAWGFARLFAECIDKVHFDPARSQQGVDGQAFEQVVSRFERYLQLAGQPQQSYGVLIHDNNETVARKHTVMMREFHRRGTLWTNVDNIIETPLFVDSQLTSMVQVADLCAYAIRRFLENGEADVFDLVFERADRKDGIVVGIRHFTDRSCACTICASHRRT